MLLRLHRTAALVLILRSLSPPASVASLARSLAVPHTFHSRVTLSGCQYACRGVTQLLRRAVAGTELAELKAWVATQYASGFVNAS